MEKVTAYKAFNGRLFDTEEKCLKYENKLAQYPKFSVVSRIPMIEGKVDMVKVKYQEKPSSQTYFQEYFDILGTNIRVYCEKCYPFDDLEKFMDNEYPVIERIVISHIARVGGIDKALASACCKVFNENEIGGQMKFLSYNVGKCWRFADDRYFRGKIGCSRHFCKVAKIEQGENEINIFKMMQRKVVVTLNDFSLTE